jgi:uncharacterized protein YeaO (DUF488 family)
VTAHAPIAIALKRAYDPSKRGDGFRVLVDRLWPRGVTKEDLAVDLWAKDLGPSNELRTWFGHEPERWAEFAKRYRAELSAARASASIDAIVARAKPRKTITLVYSAKDEERNQAVVLRAYFERAAARGARA